MASIKLYLDECGISASEAPRRGRVRRGEELYLRKPYMYTRFSMIAAISSIGYVKVELIKGSVNDTNFKAFCLENQPIDPDAPNLGGPPLTDLLPQRSFIVWDRLGRSGRKLEPCRIHYNPDVHSALAKQQIAVKMLPPKGHVLNPIELFNNVIQRKVAAFADTEKDEYSRNIRYGPKSFADCRKALSAVLEELKGKPTMFKGFYNKRAYGHELEKRIKNSTEAQKAINERSEVLINVRFDEFEE